MCKAGLGGSIGLEIQGHLPDALWMPLPNWVDLPRYEDLTDRMRLWMEVVEAIRNRLGPDLLTGIRFTADERVGCWGLAGSRWPAGR